MRENGFRAIGGLAQRLTSGIAAQRGKGGRGASIARLRAEWTAIVGPDLARITQPEALLAGRGARAGGKALRLRVPGASALEIQHKTGQLVERVNAYFGHRMIDEIRLVQGPIAVRAAPPATPAPDPATVTRVAERAAAVKDPELRAALARLGARVATGRRARAAGCARVGLARPRALRAQDLSRNKLLDALPGDHILGKPDAPNILIDYASFTCPHCANFYIAVLPTLRKRVDRHRQAAAYLSPFPVRSRWRPGQASSPNARGPTSSSPRSTLLFRKPGRLADRVGDPEVEMVKVHGKPGGDAGRRPGLLRQRPAFGQSRCRRAVRPGARGAVYAHLVHQRGELRQSRAAPRPSTQFCARWGGNRLTPHRRNSQDVVERKTECGIS